MKNKHGYKTDADGYTGHTGDINPKKRIVCLCGSVRFWKTFQEQEMRVLKHGRSIVLSLAPPPGDIELDSRARQELLELHKRKIDLSDEILVLNVGGYIGESTRSEIDYARDIGKPINYLEPIA